MQTYFGTCLDSGRKTKKMLVLEKVILPFTAILSIGANGKCNIGQKPACLSQAKPDEFAGFRYETQS